MADFTEEILKREITNGEAMVEQLTGIKEALSNSGSGGNVTSGPLWVWIYEVTEETENGLNLQTFTDGPGEPGTGDTINTRFRTDKTASEIRAAAGRGVIFAFYSKDEDEDGTFHNVTILDAYTLNTYEGLLVLNGAGEGAMVENSETGYLETITE